MKQLLRVHEILAKYPLSHSKFRRLLADRNSNGLGTAVHKIGVVLYIDQEKFESWLDSYGSTGKRYVVVKH